MQLEILEWLARVPGFNAKPMTERPEDWDRVLELSSYVPVTHSRGMIRYQISYIACQLCPCEDASLVFYHDGRPVAVWPLSLRHRESGWELGSNEGDVLPPLFIAGLGSRVLKTVMAEMLVFIRKLCIAYGIPEWRGRESFQGQYDFSPWHCQLMVNGAQVQLAHELYVDLSLDIASIKSSFRRSYRSLLTSGLKLWSVSVLYRDESAAFEEFRELHKQVAGRITRHIDTWAEQERAIRDGDAFLIFLRSAEGVMVGGGLFHLSVDEGMYAVGVYDRTLFDKPLGHLVQARAIEEMKKMGLRWYKIGGRVYPGDSPAPNEKELSIAHFKEGFATHVFPRLCTRHLVSPEPTGRDA